MTLRNTANSYGLVTKTFHWLTAFLIIGVAVGAMAADNLATTDPDSLALKIRLYSLHKTFGLAIFFTALLRILWAASQPKPGMIGGSGGVQGFLAELAHWALYASLLLVPLTGWMTHAATEGFAPIKWPFGQELPFIPNDPVLAEHFATAHDFFKTAMLAILGLHVAGALKHHLIDRDATLQRMWFGRVAAPGVGVAPSRHALAPAICAGVLCVAVGVAAALQPVEHGGATTQKLEQAASEWRVLDGALRITVNQFGTDVTGEFADWTAAIRFDPQASGAVKGAVEARIAIGSLTLGGITAEALAPDGLDADAFPVATVTGDILSVGDSYELRGVVAVKGREAPLVLPFDLTLKGDVAEASGAVTLQRLDFNVGESMQDDGSIGFSVAVALDLRATTAPESPTEGD